MYFCKEGSSQIEENYSNPTENRNMLWKVLFFTRKTILFSFQKDIGSSDYRVIVLLNSTQLNISANNSTSQLYQAKNELRIDFYSISNFDEILQGWSEQKKAMMHSRKCY